MPSVLKQRDVIFGAVQQHNDHLTPREAANYHPIWVTAISNAGITRNTPSI